MTMAMVAVTFCGQAWLGTGAPALAATVTDTFEFKAPTIKEFCQGNPKFFHIGSVKVAEGVTLTLTRDVLNAGDLTDIQATINNTGIADIDAIIMNGLSFPKNTSGSKEALVLSGVNLGNTDHFITIQGKAKFDPPGTLTKVTGTLVFQFTHTYPLATGGESTPVECFGSFTFETKNKLAL
jgi:hypothetical protein